MLLKEQVCVCPLRLKKTGQEFHFDIYHIRQMLLLLYGGKKIGICNSDGTKVKQHTFPGV